MKRLILLLITIIGTACGDTESNNNLSLVGAWVTQACTQGTEINGFSVNVWLRGKYEFATSGFLFFEQEQYMDSQCINKAPSITQTNLDSPVTYTDLGSVTLQEGIQGHELIIIGDTTPTTNIELHGFYTINNGVLCFSDIFTFAPLYLDFSGSGVDDINFTECLIKWQP